MGKHPTVRDESLCLLRYYNNDYKWLMGVSEETENSLSRLADKEIVSYTEIGVT